VTEGWFVRLLVITVLLQTAVYAVRSMVSYQALALGADNAQLGIVAAAYASLSLLVAVPVGRWVDRWGEPRFVLMGGAVIGGVSLWLVFIDSLVALAVSQAALGFGHIAAVVGSQALVANRGAPGRRDARFGVFTVVVSTGQLAGPAIGGLLGGQGGTGFDGTLLFGAMAALTIPGLVLAWLLLPERADRSGEEPGPSGPGDSSWQALNRVLRIPSMPNAMIASLTVLTTIDLIAVYLPAYGEANGLSVETVGLLLAVRAAASMASRLLMLQLITWLGRKWLLLVSIALPAAALLALPAFDGPVMLAVLLLIAGFGLGLGQPITLAWVADRAPRKVRGTALGVRLSGNRLGQVVLPLAVGAIAGGSGLAAAFAAMAAMLGGSAVAVLGADFEPGAEP
jgi:MFS family permease